LSNRAKETASRRLLVAVLAATVLLFPNSSWAQVQISDQFTRVAKDLAKQAVKHELSGVCGDKSPDPVCVQVVKSITDIFGMVIDGKIDAQHVGTLLRSEFAKVVPAVAGDVAKTLIGSVLEKVTPPTGKCSARGLAQPVAACLVARAYGGKAGSKAECDGASLALGTLLTNCGASPPAPNTDALDLLKAVQAALEKVEDKPGAVSKATDFPDVYGAVVVLAQTRRIAERASAGSFYSIAQGIADSHAAFMEDLELLGSQGAFDRTEIGAVAESTAACPGRDAVVARARAWQEAYWSTFFKVGRALARLDPLPRDAMASLPDDLPDPGCSAPDDPLEQAARVLRRDARVFRVDANLLAQTQKGILPALLVAILVDYVRTEDEALLAESLKDFVLQALARVMAAAEAGDQLVCSAVESGLSCQETPDGAPKVFARDPGIAKDADLYALLASRRSPRSARRTCAYQAVAAVLEGKFPFSSGIGNRCRVGRVSLDRTLFGDHLAEVDGVPGIEQWKDLARSITPGFATVHLASPPSPGDASELLEFVVPKIETAQGLSEAARLPFDSAVQALKIGSGGRRDLLRVAAEAFRPELQDALEDFLPGTKNCGRSTELVCGVRTLIEAAYDPVMTYVSEPSPTDADRQHVAESFLEQLDTLDPLGKSPLLFDIGPGVTLLTRLGASGLTAHLTLVDKYGWAPLRFGPRNEWQLGIFVGGFVDALVQKLSGNTDVVSYWLSGVSFGFRQFSKGFPLGLEVYVASGNPFDLRHFGDYVGFATGLNVLVPVEEAFPSSNP
jgi:hypothetical protein